MNPSGSAYRNLLARTAVHDGVGWVVLLVGVSVLALGCTQRSTDGLVLKSQSRHGAALVGGFTSSLYSIDDPHSLTLLLLNGAVDDPIQAVVIRMFWKPRAGRTPIDPTATNATIHYAIFAGDDRREVGVYSGAGFVFPQGKPGRETFNANIWQATLRLTDSTVGFADLLGGAILEGHVTATRDDAAVGRALSRLRVLINQRMGYPRWVGSGRWQANPRFDRGVIASTETRPGGLAHGGGCTGR